MQRKTKFASAAKKKQHAQLAEEWDKLQATWANVPKFGSGKPPKPVKKSPEKQPINNERIPSLGANTIMIFHFVYKTTHRNGRYYIGRHSTANVDDGYLGSGVWVSSVKDRASLSKEILFFANSSSELKILEESTIKAHWDDHLCMNRSQSGNGWTSEEAHNENIRRVSAGTHNFLDGGPQRVNQLRRAAEGVHQWQGDRNPVHVRLTDGSHHWLGDQHKELTSIRNKQRLDNGTHHLLLTVQCPHCNKYGQMTAMKRWHFDNCRHQ